MFGHRLIRRLSSPIADGGTACRTERSTGDGPRGTPHDPARDPAQEGAECGAGEGFLTIVEGVAVTALVRERLVPTLPS